MSPPDGDAASLAYPHAAPPAPGTLTEVAPGVHWLRMPLPYKLDHINLWLLEDGVGWTMVDTGIDCAATRALWEQIFAASLGGRRVTRLIVTHFHPDHMGLAGWLTKLWGIELWVTEAEWLWGRMLSRDDDHAGFAADQAPFYRRTGIDEATVAAITAGGNSYAPRVSPVPRSFRRIADGDTIAIGGHDWRVIVGRGHAPEHACLSCPSLDLFIAGDQVLPKISPNVSVWPTEPDGDPLSRYLTSLETLRAAVADSVLVLPSHNLPFRGLHARIDQLAEHHRERLDAVIEACATPRSARDIVPFLFRRELDAHQMMFAVGEALAHLHLLWAAGKLSRNAGIDAVYRFVRA